MNGNSIILDTNILLYLLGGNKDWSKILNGLELYVSVISEIELLGYQNLTKIDKIKIKDFLSECHIIALNDEIKEICILIKQNLRIKTPDAIIAATSQFLDIPLISADIGLEKIHNLDLILFKL